MYVYIYIYTYTNQEAHCQNHYHNITAFTKAKNSLDTLQSGTDKPQYATCPGSGIRGTSTTQFPWKKSLGYPWAPENAKEWQTFEELLINTAGLKRAWAG